MIFYVRRYCVIFAYFGVSFVLYIVSRFNSAEWITETEGILNNQFSFPNALWFSFAALVQQGSDLSPRFDNFPKIIYYVNEYNSHATESAAYTYNFFNFQSRLRFCNCFPQLLQLLLLFLHVFANLQTTKPHL